MTPSDGSVHLYSLGGLGEIGLNLMVFEAEGKLLLIDCGLMFPDPSLTGVDLVLPDISSLDDKKEAILAIILTHGHEDHIGAVPFLWQRLGRPAIYGTKLTLALLRSRLEEHQMGAAGRLHEIDPQSRRTFGPFSVDFFAVSHSIGDGVGLALQTPAGRVIHTGDFKLDPTPVDGRRTDTERLRRYGEEGVLLLLSDSTNAEHEGRSPSETSVGKTFQELLPQCRGRVFLSTFSSNIHRIQQAIDAATLVGRKVAIHGRSMETNVAIARRLGYLRAPDHLLVSLKHALTMPRSQSLILTTGSQGEPMSGLMRIALGEHKEIRIEEGDRVILSSKFIPGNERAIGNLINHLCRQGAEVDYEKVSEIHVSGHASRDELAEVLQLLKPRFFVPIHGEYRHLKRHALLAEEQGVLKENIFVLENGQSLTLTPVSANRGPQVETGRILVDGKGVGDLGDREMRDRRHVAHHGVVVVMAAVTSDGEWVYGPELLARGLVAEDTDTAVIEAATKEIQDLIANHGIKSPLNTEEVQQEICQHVRRYFNRRLGRRPLVLPRIMELEINPKGRLS